MYNNIMQGCKGYIMSKPETYIPTNSKPEQTLLKVLKHEAIPENQTKNQCLNFKPNQKMSTPLNGSFSISNTPFTRMCEPSVKLVFSVHLNV